MSVIDTIQCVYATPSTPDVFGMPAKEMGRLVVYEERGMVMVRLNSITGQVVSEFCAEGEAMGSFIGACIEGFARAENISPGYVGRGA